MYLCMYVCEYVCMRVCVYACMRVYMYACRHMGSGSRADRHTALRPSSVASMCARMHACVHACTHSCAPIERSIPKTNSIWSTPSPFWSSSVIRASFSWLATIAADLRSKFRRLTRAWTHVCMSTHTHQTDRAHTHTHTQQDRKIAPPPGIAPRSRRVADFSSGLRGFYH